MCDILLSLTKNRTYQNRLSNFMLNSLLLFCVIACYLAATFLIALYIRTDISTKGEIKYLTFASIIGAIGCIANLAYWYQIGLTATSLNFSAYSMMVLISGILVAIYLLCSLAMPIRRLGIIVFPLSLFGFLLSLMWTKDSVTSLTMSKSLTMHILVSITAYALLTIATVQGLLYIYQERQIKNRATPAMLMALPPLQTMEQLLFRLIWAGFICLSLTLFSGALFSQHIFGHAFLFKHHTILPFIGWLVFVVVLFKRLKYGIRGSQAVILTIIGLVLIQLGYFGTKLISESIALN